MEKRLSRGATVAGINGDLFGDRRGAHRDPDAERRARPAADPGALEHRDRLDAARSGSAASRCSRPGRAPARAARSVEVNGSPKANGVSLYTPAWGRRRPRSPGPPGDALAASRRRAERRAHRPGHRGHRLHGGTPIPPGGAVLVARGTAAERLQAEAPVGRTVKIRLILKPAWPAWSTRSAAGPVLVQDRPADLPRQRAVPRRPAAHAHGAHRGRPAARRPLPARHDRRRAARLQRGRDELRARAGDGQARRRHGRGARRRRLVRDGLRGDACSRASAGPERPIGDALVVAYTGVYLPPPAEAVLSPNGDGVAERQTLAYKLVRQSNGDRQPARPRRRRAQSFSGTLPAGHVSVRRGPGLNADGTPRSRAAGAGSSPRPTTAADVDGRARLRPEPHARLRPSGRADASPSPGARLAPSPPSSSPARRR